MQSKQLQKFIFETKNILKIEQYLQLHGDFDPRSILDKKQNNILHHLSFHDHKDLIKLYINHTTKIIEKNIRQSKQIYKKDGKLEIASWVNQKNQQGFTPLLYASFNGHIDLISYLLQIGANSSISSNTKLNVLHVAVQNNKVQSLICFRNQIDYNLQDQKGSTPLHWAAYTGSQQAAAFLLTLPNIQIDIRDNQGQTPLFLATLYGNTKIVRRLLIKGANRRLKNKKNQLPIHIAEQNQFKNITKMLNDNYTLFDFLKFYYNVKLEYKPKDRSYIIPIVFLITALCSIFIINMLLQPTQKYCYIIEAVVFGIMFLLYLSLLRSPKIQQKQDINIYINETKKVCFECIKKKPKRSYHCDICKTCISQYDHHCTWINNCVGKRNIARFILFIFFLLISLSIIGFTSICGFLMTIQNNQKKKMLFLQSAYKDLQVAQKIGVFALFSINIVISLFWLPVFLLFLVQIKNLLINKTTYQRIRGENSSVRDQLRQKKKRRPSLANCRIMCQNIQESFSSDHQHQHQHEHQHQQENSTISK